MTDDPRAQDRERAASFHRELTHAQQLDRMHKRLSPADDLLATPAAVRHHQEVADAMRSWRKHHRKDAETAQ